MTRGYCADRSVVSCQLKTSWVVAGSQILILPSLPAEAMNLPGGVTTSSTQP
jgi:hypothetical protein